MERTDLLITQSRPRRVEGGVRAVFRAYGTRTGVCDLDERDGYRMRFPRGADCEGVLLNTGGGVVAGDRITHHISLLERTTVTVTTPSAERVYRSAGDMAHVAVSIQLGAAASLAWLPQETISYDRARLSRRFDVAIHESASLLMSEITVFGRTAMGEVIESGLWSDRWRVRRGDRLIFAENVQFEGPLAECLRRKAIGNGANILATVLYVAPDAEGRLSAVRAVLSGANLSAGASAWNGFLCIRALATDLQVLRRTLTQAIVAMRGVAMPRVWWT